MIQTKNFVEVKETKETQEIKEDIIKEDITKEDIIKEDIIKVDIIKEDIIKEEVKDSNVRGILIRCPQETDTKASAINVARWATNGGSAQNSGFSRCRLKVPKDGKQEDHQTRRLRSRMQKQQRLRSKRTRGT